MSSFAFVLLLALAFLLLTTNTLVYAQVQLLTLEFDTTIPVHDGVANLQEGQRLFDKGNNYDKAAMHFWRAVLMQEQNKDKYTVDDCFGKFIQCFAAQDRMADGFVFVAQESAGRAQYPMAKVYLNQALSMDPSNPVALLLKQQLDELGFPLEGGGIDSLAGNDGDDDDEDDDDDDENRLFIGKSPADLYEIASTHFANREYEQCADVFEISCIRSNHQLSPSCANAVYCRNMVIDWGFNGTQFESDMRRMERIATMEIAQFRETSADGVGFSWKRAMSTHPHMMLSYPIRNAALKRYVAESAAFTEDMSQRITNQGTIDPLPSDLPFQHDFADYIKEFGSSTTDPKSWKSKLRIGFVASGFNSKAVLYLSHDMFRFFETSKFEVHIFSLGAPDSPLFIKHGMRGVDWRERVKQNVDVFHDVQKYKNNHIDLARYIQSHNIHILLEWDGYARQGDRAQGLFALRPAPIQIWHQEYLGTSGATFVDYLFTDKVTSPEKLQHLYVEKLIYLPNHFFSKGHAVQHEVVPPSLAYPLHATPYKPGSGSPQSNKCLQPNADEPSIVYCNYNKFLKSNPETVRSWIRILREVPGSMLCLLENPPQGVAYYRKFIHEAAGSVDSSDGTFVHGDGDELNRRIHFLPWQKNPFDHQQRNQDFCNVMLDSWPYNGHTTAQDSLYGGVPIVTRSDGDDMSSRVTTSANVVLGFEQQLNAYMGTTDYEDIAIRLGLNPTELNQIRTRLIHTALQRNPMHPYWDVPRYVTNFSRGLELVWTRYLQGKAPDHVTVEESDETQQGTYDHILEEHPPEGGKHRQNTKPSSRAKPVASSSSEEL